ncbi:P-loop containing nucleoside triphosphate hydrolase protein [Mycena amicta]|nr:P-loop containing nucleoside triphosphate hydrolase protein [Mycena amicta]
MSDTLCPNVLSKGSCDDPTCVHRHNVSSCKLCGLVFASPEDYAVHATTKRHVNKTRGESGATLRCPLCQIHTSGMKNWVEHVGSSRHASKATLHRVNPADVIPEEPDQIPGHTLCTTCNAYIPDRFWPRHHLRPKHVERSQFISFRTVLDEAEKDKHGISVSGNFDFGIVELSAGKSGLSMTATIQNAVPSSKVSLVGMTLASNKGTKVISPFTVACGRTGPILYKASYTFTVTFRQGFLGRAEDLLEIIFEDVQLRKRFAIVRTLSGHVGNREDHDAIRPVAPYVPRKRTDRQPETTVVEGVFPQSRKAVPYVGTLPKAPIPTNLASILSTGNTKNIVDTVRKLYLPSVFDSNGYGRHFKQLLWIEEHRMENDLGLYDISGTKLTRYQAYYYLDVPGLAEKRPSVLVGDRILVQKQGAADSGRWFEGGVHVVRQKEVGIRFHYSFPTAAPSDLFAVRFKLNRYPLRRQHLALDSAFSEDRVLFPVSRHVPATLFPTTQSMKIKLQAVVSIVKRPPGSVPFIIFGPPGTGKTVTAVETIFQVLKSDPEARVIACAPSNSAADLIATRLMDLGTDTLFRFYAPSRNKELVDLKLRDFTYTTVDGHFSVPPLARMKRFRAIVTTLVSASVVSGIGIPRGHYSHIFIDEAGQATEPEAMIVIQTMADSKTNIVLSGDPKQLGPIIRSNIARELGLETSYIERLMKREIYDETTGYGKSVVKLIKNFRSHNSILKFPNEQFYKGELQPHGDPKITDLYLKSPLLAKKGFPIIFHALTGKDDREASSPSFFNIDEASQVRNYVRTLREDRAVRITDADIGVIAPYHAQCVKLRTLLKPVAEGVKVGSVEEFQGQERKVIIVSTVRSSREFVNYDLRHTLGFVANPRRFNVTVTRAQSLLIVVGDPNVLGLDPLWRAFLNYVYINGGWSAGGPDIPWDPHSAVDELAGNAYADQARSGAALDMNAFTRRMEALTVAGAEEEDDDDVNVNVDRPWREAE